MLISDVEDAEDAIRLLSAVNGSAVQDYYWARVGKEPTVFVTATNEETVSVTLDPGRGVYYLLIEQGKEGGTLTWLPVEQEGLGVSRKTDDDVYAITDIFYGNRMLYYRDVTREKGTLCGANAGSKEKLSEGAAVAGGKWFRHDAAAGLQPGAGDGRTDPLSGQQQAGGHRCPCLQLSHQELYLCPALLQHHQRKGRFVSLYRQ